MSDRLSQSPGSSPDRPAPGNAAPRARAAARRSRGPAALIVRGLANLLAVGVLVYLTYFFTMFFAHKPPPPAPVPEDVRIAAKKIEVLKAEDRKLLSTYGEVDPITKTLRIPVDRAMELVVAESAKPAPPPAFTLAPAAVPAAAKPGPATATPKPETVAAKPATPTTKPETARPATP